MKVNVRSVRVLGIGLMINTFKEYYKQNQIGKVNNVVDSDLYGFRMLYYNGINGNSNSMEREW
jgi:hypothetical protein